MAASISELVSERTKETEEALLLSELQAEAFPVTDWNPGGVARTIVKATAYAISDLSTTVKSVVQGAHLELARKLKDRSWMDLLSTGWYGLTRTEATYTRQKVRLWNDAGAGPHPISAAGASIVTVALGGRRYSNVTTGTVPLGPGSETSNYLELEYIAEAPGAEYADQAGTLTVLVTPLPGLHASNVAPAFGGLDTALRAKKSVAAQGTGYITPSGTPTLVRTYTVTVTASGDQPTTGAIKIEYTAAGVTTLVANIAPIPASYAGIGDGITLTFANGAGAGFILGDVHTFSTPGTPIVIQGADVETNDALADRAIGRWPALSANAVGGKFATWIRQASLENGYGIERITVRPSATVAGVANIMVATASGTPGGGVLAGLQAYINARTSITEKGEVIAAVNEPITLDGAVTVPLDQLEAAQDAADAAWAAYIRDLAIGGDTKTGSPGVVRLAELQQALMDAGAIDVTGLMLNGVAANKTLANDQVAVIGAGEEPSAALTWNTVA